MKYEANIQGRRVYVISDKRTNDEKGCPPFNTEGKNCPVVECRNIADYIDNNEYLGLAAKFALKNKKNISELGFLYDVLKLEKSPVLYSIKNVKIDKIETPTREQDIDEAEKKGLSTILMKNHFTLIDDSGKSFVGRKWMDYFWKEGDLMDVIACKPNDYSILGIPSDSDLFSIVNFSFEKRYKENQENSNMWRNGNY